MTVEREKRFKTIVNSSGFIFQLALEYKIKRTRKDHHWEVIAHEHPWHDSETGAHGFIDLILKKGRFCLVIECKRPSDAVWIFINPNNKRDKVDRARLLWVHSYEATQGMTYFPDPTCGWSDFEFTPESPQSEFCSIRGQGETDSPLLERISSQLISSVECLAHEEIEMTKHRKEENTNIYIPVIVTTAQLELCHFDPEKISLSDGKLSQGSFTPSPSILFRKSLVTQSNSFVTDIRQANEDKTRTVLVVNSNSFCEILKSINIDRLDKTSPWPWR
jgi:hypothetical protein